VELCLRGIERRQKTVEHPVATLGLIGFLNTIPNLIFALPARALADRYDRRTLLLVFQSLNMALAPALAVTRATGTLTVGLLGVLAVLGGILGTLSFAPFQAMLAAMAPRRDLESAVAINSLSLQVARFVGPAGFLLVVAGPTWVFGVNAASFVAVLGALALLPGSRPVRRAAATGGGAISEAFRYVFGQRSLARHGWCRFTNLAVFLSASRRARAVACGTWHPNAFAGRSTRSPSSRGSACSKSAAAPVSPRRSSASSSSTATCY
jgi:MFS family permease